MDVEGIDCCCFKLLEDIILYGFWASELSSRGVPEHYELRSEALGTLRVLPVRAVPTKQGSVLQIPFEKPRAHTRGPKAPPRLGSKCLYAVISLGIHLYSYFNITIRSC